MNEIVDTQCKHWDETFSERPEMFGTEPSEPAQVAARLFKEEQVTKILELGGGQGRDTLHFAREGYQVHVLDYSESAIGTIIDKAEEVGLAGLVTALRYDVRQPLPFDDASFDACYSHMLFCMPLTTEELERLSSEVRRVVRPGGLHIYTARNTSDPHYGKGVHRGEDMYEVGGFVVHFFSREKIESLAAGFEILEITECEESSLPRKLFRVALRKKHV